MIGASKILTVSYGTFSCTLEGFDEPFSTMKAIAEYFRDLAAEDRYFGAVPPTPDADMLHRIAEREIQRRVEAKISEHGIVLRQAPASEPLPQAQPTPAVAEEIAPPVVVASPVVVATAPLPADDDSISAKLARIRAAVSASREAAVAPVATLAFDVADAGDEEQDPLFTADDAANGQSFSFDIDLPDLGHHGTEGHAAAVTDDEPAAETVEPVIDLEATPVAIEATTSTPVEETIAAEVVAAPADMTAEGEPAAEVAPEAEADDDWSARLDAITEEMATTSEYDADDAVMNDASAIEDTDDLVARLALSDDTVADEVAIAPTATDGWDDDDTAEMLRTHMTDDGWTDEDLVTDEDLADLAAMDGVSADAQGMSDDIGAEAAEQLETPVAHDMIDDLVAEVDAAPLADTETAENLVAALHDDLDHDAADDTADGVADDITPATDVSPAPVAPARPGFLSRARARVIKVRKPAADEATPDVHLLLPAVETHLQPADHGQMSVADEAADYADAAYLPDDNAGDDAVEAQHGHDGRAILENAAPDNDEGVSRLMDEAATKLEGAENRRRFSAISHLKAAVAATVADRKMKPQDAPADPRDDVDDLGLYRDDLSKAVRPRRPVAETATTATRRPSMDTRPAPLVLVSEQRVDTPDDMRHAGAIVRPRRISSGTMVLAEEADDDIDEIDEPISPEDAASFAEFADRLGATSLTELLEAAAAYTASVEGHPHFSRPHILKKVAHVTDENDFTREDGLRSFGMLLRQGKIQKVRRGQFALTDHSRFKSEARRASN